MRKGLTILLLLISVGVFSQKVRVSGGNAVLLDSTDTKALVDDSIVPIGFSATNTSTQSVSNNTWTKLTIFDDELWDSEGWYSSNTFTPLSEGWYLIGGSVTTATMSAGKKIVASFYFNGKSYTQIGRAVTGASDKLSVNGSVPIYFDGVDDYVDFYIYQGNGTSLLVGNNATHCSFWAYKL